jgi:hypothetical protein
MSCSCWLINSRIFGPQIKRSSEVDAFVKLLVTQHVRPHPSLFVVFTIQSDYLGWCASYPGLSNAINRCQYLAPALTESELREAIVCPAEDYGAHVTENLVAEILADMRPGTAYDADNLPLMQHALLFLWQNAPKSGLPGPSGPNAAPAVTLDADEYRKFGRLRGILGRHADAILRDAAGANNERGAIAEALFRRLAERDSNGRYRQSPAAFDEVKEIASCTEAELKQVIAPFADEKASFLEIRKSERADEDLLDISHEALIRTWDNARAWTDREAEKIHTFCDLLRWAEAWQDEGKNPSYLKQRRELDVLEQWWSRSTPTISWAKRYFEQNGRGPGAAAAIGLVTRYRDASIAARDASYTAPIQRHDMVADKGSSNRVNNLKTGNAAPRRPVLKGFFSYTHRDAEVDPLIVEAFSSHLEERVDAKLVNARFEIWRDKEKLQLGDHWDQRIGSAIDSSHIFIVLLTPKWISSDYCRHEFEAFVKIEAARNSGGYVIPIYARDIKGQEKFLEDEQRKLLDRLKLIQYQQIIPQQFARLSDNERIDLIEGVADPICDMLDRLREKLDASISATILRG